MGEIHHGKAMRGDEFFRMIDSPEWQEEQRKKQEEREAAEAALPPEERKRLQKEREERIAYLRRSPGFASMPLPPRPKKKGEKNGS